MSEMNLRQKLKKKSGNGVFRPVDVFKECPACECPDLIACDGDVICSKCDWNSIELWVDAKLDALMARSSGAEVIPYPYTNKQTAQEAG